MGKGLFSPHTSSVVYSQDFSPWRAPQMWKSAVSIFMTGFVAGIVVFCVVLAKSDKGIVDSSDPRLAPTVTVSVEVPARKAKR